MVLLVQNDNPVNVSAEVLHSRIESVKKMLIDGAFAHARYDDSFRRDHAAYKSNQS